jgi:hypothetical protein
MHIVLSFNIPLQTIQESGFLKDDDTIAKSRVWYEIDRYHILFQSRLLSAGLGTHSSRLTYLTFVDSPHVFCSSQLHCLFNFHAALFSVSIT